MYLKCIKAHGFKSFADKITIDLDNNITGIVGPNGSGKSNIVDAIRWVLGEQSVKSLRGDGNMTDVIFSGSKSRNSANVASVTLVFDNTDHYLPFDYNEVSIKRRVYKDGTNEYFIINEKVRLKDVTDLLLDSGIAKESFNIISQGKIDVILSNKPEDKRIIFEEAAGVLKYKRRKEEALRKLDKTHNNMNRVNDIINELEVQIEPLKDQKEKALEYQSTSEELKELEVALIADDITNLNFEYQNSKNKVDLLTDEIAKISTDNSSNEAKIEKYKKDINDLDLKIKNEQNNLIEITTKVEKLNSRKEIIIERQKYKVEDMKLHDNLISLKEKQLKLTNDINNLNIKLKNITDEIVDYERKITIENNNLKEFKNNKIRLDDNLQKYLKIENNLKIKIDSLQISIDNNSNVPYAVKKVLENPKLRGIHDIIGNLFEVEEKYSLAISTVLGASISNIVVDNEICAKEAINYLKENNIGRATFFPLNIIKPKAINIKVDGIIGIASDLVKYDPKYSSIILNQLGNVIVVDNIDTANTIAKNINYTYRIVTLGGELLHLGGSLTGGNGGKVRNVILDKYELESSLKELNNVNNSIATIEEKINGIDSNLKIIEDKIYLINKEKLNKTILYDGIKKNIIDLEEKLKVTTFEIEGTNNTLNNTLNDEETKVLNEYYDSLKLKDENINRINILNKNKEELSEELSDYELSLKKENVLFNDKNNELKNLEINVNRLDVKLDNLLNSLSENYSLTYEAAISKYKLEIPINIARNKVNVLKSKIKEIGIVNVGAIEEFDRVNERFIFLSKQRDDLTKAENTLLEIIDEMDKVMEKDFMTTFKAIKENFNTTFKELFKGGNADLKLTDPNNILETGIEIVATPPGKSLKSISLLSGGEKTLTAISLLFAILKSKPVPFCVLDEVEAALDDVNVECFGDYVNKFKNKTQFIIITHKKKTMEYVDTLYGITMQESGVSKLVSVKLEEIK